MSKIHPYVRSITLANLPEFIEKLGGNPNLIFKQVGLNPEDARKNNNTLISWPNVCNLLELCATEFNDPFFGINWANEISDDFPNSGPMIFAAAMVPSARKFLEISQRYQKIHSNGVRHEFVEDEVSGRATYSMHFHPMTPPCRQITEHVAAEICRMIHSLMNDVNFLEIHFPHNCLGAIDIYEKKFRCRVIFNSDQFKFVGRVSDLDKPINGPLGNPQFNGSLHFLQPLLNKYLDRRLKKNRISETPITDTLSEILPAIFGTGKSDINSVAIALGLSTKKMQRLLKIEGSNYSTIRDSTRHNITERLLRESDIPITDLALSLDYQSSEAFNTACQRWVGLSPRGYRAKLRSQKLFSQSAASPQ